MTGTVLVKFTNCCYFRGGGKVPYRIRKFQNHTHRVNGEWLNKNSDEYIISCLSYLTNGKYKPTSTTKLIRYGTTMCQW